MSLESAAARLYSGDVTIFQGNSAPFATGWLQHPRDLESSLAQYEQALRLRPLRYEPTVLIGMGGSSAPAAMFGSLINSTRLRVLDTSHPDSIAAQSFEAVNVVASSKSGSTIETVTTLAWALGHGLDPRDLTVITDPGTSLEQLARSLGARVVSGDPRSGGRYSALSAFGLVPALIAGWTSSQILDSLGGAVDEAQFVTWFREGALGSSLVTGIEFLELARAPRAGSAQLWLEQLVAESTGKLGRGIVPVVVEGTADRAPERAGVARDIFAWHVRCAAMAWRLEVDPFNQPDVELSKANVFDELSQKIKWNGATKISGDELRALEGAGYVSLQVYGELALDEEVEVLRRSLQGRFSRVTAALGPRFLHSTGQLHKGGPDSVLALQVSVRPTSAAARIPGRGFTFAQLHAAQARADARALRARGRRVVELRVESLDEVAELFGPVSTMVQ